MSGTKGRWGNGDAAEKAVAEVKLEAGTEAELPTVRSRSASRRRRGPERGLVIRLLRPAGSLCALASAVELVLEDRDTAVQQRCDRQGRVCDIEDGVQGYTGRQSTGPGI
ncbi:hypothetical protein [Bosea beijingensis]|uniref:hypothetical protein n=1 Tax=Bosea beijingensis TaxID=3068632 RepID=UPI0027411DAE|nr:hypothetical protein [Bosea sp. REN20]